jgi:RNAse (barnase) inhibitor barstar
MSKLLQRLQDSSRSGVYRARRPDEILDAVRGSNLDLARIVFPDGKNLLQSIAGALSFPEWFGQNWDALEDCLSDLSWREAAGHVLVFENAAAGDELGILTDVLAAAAEFWQGRGKPFFAVFIDPQHQLTLPELFREA